MSGARSVRFVVLVLVLCTVTGAVLQATRHTSGIAEDTFLDRKLSWRAAFDVVLAGDSRVEEGLSPAELQAGLPGRRVGNVAFRGVGWEERYLDAVGCALDPASLARCIVLGVDPRSFTTRATSYNSFLGTNRRSPFEKWAHRTLGDVLAWLQPADLGVLLSTGPQYERRYIFHADGWRACRSHPLQPTERLRWYRQELGGQRILPAAASALLAAVSRWSASGIRVYALRVPTTTEMAEMEDRVTGFDEPAMVARLVAAGARWLPFDAGTYHTYDGSHLVESEALRFSRDVARRLATLEPERR